MRRYAKILPIAAVCVGLVLVILLLTLLTDLPRENPGQPEEEEAVTISLVYAYQNSQWNACIEEVVRRFETDHPDIHIRYEIHYEDMVYEDLLNKLIARDELGDVIQLKEPYAFASSGLIAPLPQELARLVDFRCDLDGETYAVAALGATTGVVYNKTLFDACGLTLPESYSEFLTLCASLRLRGVSPLGIGGKDLWHFEYWLNHFLRSDVLSVEPDFLAKCRTGERSWTDPLAADLFTHLRALFQWNYVNQNWPSTPDGALAYHMAEGEVAMVFSGPWLIADVQALAPELELGWFYPPNARGEVVAGDSVDVFWAVTDGCARDEARYEAAVTFLNYFYSEGVYEEVCRAMSGYSTLADQDRGRYPLNDVTTQLVEARSAADLHFTAYVGDENTPAGFEKRLLALLAELCAGQRTVAEAQALAQEYWEQCLSQEAAYG